MARHWPSFVRRAQPTARVSAEIVLLAVFLAAVSLAFSWRDGRPSHEDMESVGTTKSGIASTLALGKNLDSDRPYRVASAPVEEPPPTQAPIPTALPVQLLIPAMDVHRAVESVGVDRFGVMNLPTNWWDAGWYKGSPVPGAPGDAVIEGHAGFPKQPLIFGRLATLRPADRIVVVDSAGIRRLFLVVSTNSVPAGSAPVGMAEPYGPPRLTLITCGGRFDKNRSTYSERLVVEASFAGIV